MQIPAGYIVISKDDYKQLLNRLEKQEARIKELEGMLHKDSHNSHKPPSSDAFRKPIKNSRIKGEHTQGGQPGSKGTTLKMVAKPDKQVRCKAQGRCSCGTSLHELPVLRIEKRQEFDLPPKLIEVTEYEVEVKKCTCGKEHKAECPVQAPVQYGKRILALAVGLNQYQMLPYERLQEFFGDYFGVSVSDWWLNKTNEVCYENLAPAEEAIKQALIMSEVLHSDETGLRSAGQRQWVHVASTATHTHYDIHTKRGKEAMDAIGILPHFTGNSVHDRYGSYEKYTNCQHANCNAHHLRDLLYIEEEMGRKWAKRMRRLLIRSNHLKKQGALNETMIGSLSEQYDTILSKALLKEPSEPIPELGKRGRKAKNKSRRLIETMQQKKEQTLRFLFDPKIPFDNNQAERDLRMIKVKQKISGCFRTFHGAKVFCRIRSYISSVKKQGYNVLDAITFALNKQPYFAHAPY
jgi:transposase